MIGILLLYFVWKRFADLATKYNRRRMANGWLGILGYIGGTFFAGITLGLFDAFLDLGIDWENNALLNLVGIPLGLLACYLLFIFLEKKWTSEIIDTNTIDDIGKLTSE